MTKALITGIQGFAGSHLAEFLLSKGYKVYGFDLNLGATDHLLNIKDHLVLFECDIREQARLYEIISQCKPLEIYHLAAIADIPNSFRDPKFTFEVNLFGSLNVFEATKAVSNSIKVLYVGSATEYGDVREQEIPIDEDVPLRPTDPYSVSKVSADMLAFQYFKSFNTHIVRVRPFNHIGPRQSDEFVSSSFAKQIVEIEKGLKNPIINVGNLEAKRDFTDVRDMVKAYWLAIQKGEPGDIYNICSGKAISIKGLLEKLLSMSNKEIRVEQDLKKLRPVDVPLLMGKSEKFMQQTGWNMEFTLEKTLQSILNYWREKVE